MSSPHRGQVNDVLWHEVKHLWGQRLVILLWCFEKQYQGWGGWDLPDICSSSRTPDKILVEQDGLSGDLTSWCRGHVHQLAHGIGNYLETHGWPEARYSAQRDWVQPEFLTNTRAVKSSFTLHDLLNRLLVSLSISHVQLHNLPHVFILDQESGITCDPGD